MWREPARNSPTPTFPAFSCTGYKPGWDDGSAVEIGTHQDDDGFGLHGRTSDQASDDGHWNGIYRWRPFPELPTGPVDHVSVFHERHFPAKVHSGSEHGHWRRSGVNWEETHEGELVFQRLDESVLAFTDLVAVEHVPWDTARQVHPVAF
ncbi:hypothetical protein [Amycolatopsis sp. cmx-4-54]|uniref:hypothetical protein n=1 Tax=Amycolatopsis sp. cmx-4-54 TaxID=2790936 RepID=UPI00397A0C53